MKAVLLVCLLLLGSACRGRVAPTLPAEDVGPPPLAPAFSESGQAPLSNRWWGAFEDEGLDSLVDTALASNPDIGALHARMQRAEALARRVDADRRPSLDLGAGASGLATGTDSDGGGTNSAEAFSFGAAAAYEVDLWGRLRALRDAALWEAHATAGDLQAARMTLAAAVATAWYGLVAERAIGRLLEQQRLNNEKVLSLIEARFRQGKIGASDVLRQQQLVEATNGQHIQSASRAAVLENGLTTLVGRPVGDPLPDTPEALSAPPPLPETGVPIDILRRRPDVAAAHARVFAADHSLAAALADRYPRLSLSAEGLLGGGGLTLLLQDWLARIAADLTAPVLDGGARRSQIEAERALRLERLHRYSESILLALQEVEDALVQERKATEYHASLAQQSVLADRVVDTLLGRYGQGSAPYLDVLAALTTAQGLARDLVDAQRAVLSHRIALCRALAGDWRTNTPTCAPAAGTATRPEAGR